MARMICPECRVEVPRSAWACPECGKPGEVVEGKDAGNDLSSKGMLLLLLLFVAFPVLLFLLHIFVPGL